MDSATQMLVIPEVTYSLVAILALLVVWQYYTNQVLAGRIYAVDFWDMSGIRMFLQVTIWDGQACEVCQAASGSVFLPSLATKMGFSTLPEPCRHACGCRCLFVGLYGGWPEANKLLERLRKYGRRKPVKLSGQELLELFEGPWRRSITAANDQLTIHMLEAMQVEGEDPEGAMTKYSYIIDHAKGARDVRLVVPAFLRLSAVLERLSRHDDAIAVIDEFERRFPQNRRRFYFPSDEQRGMMATRRYRLQVNLQRRQGWSAEAPPVYGQAATADDSDWEELPEGSA